MVRPLVAGLVFGLCGVTALSGCSAGGSDAAGDDSASEDALTKSGALVCNDLGTNVPTLIQFQGDQATMTRRGDSSGQTGPKIADPAPGFSGYQIDTDTTIWVSADKTKVEMHETNVGPSWDGDCRKATSKDLTTDACALLLHDMGVGSKRPKVEKLSDTAYKITASTAKGGDFVWNVKTAGSGFFCNVQGLKPLSCAAIVNDKVGDKARDDGSSAGSPWVYKGSDSTHWTGGIHDPESGEFAYDITTSSSDDGCKITSITAQK